MPSLKNLRIRINSVKQTRKITSAMKLVAASKLRRAQEAAEAARPYSERLERMVSSLAQAMGGRPDGNPLLVGTGQDKTHLIVLATADRGLCGAFNSSIVRATRRRIQAELKEGKAVKLFCVGRKGREQISRDYATLIVEQVQGIGRRGPKYEEAAAIAERLTALYAEGAFDSCTIVYNRFRSVISQVVTFQRLIPFAPADAGANAGEAQPKDTASYEFEPDEGEIVGELLPRNLAVQVFRALLENAASEQGARMSAMDNATRNAGDMIDKLTLNYNRTRQAQITKELIEIVSGAEAL
ncbi:MAG: F0F1 ATP synthase subunit gamma [Alphaproteobacteria bacterium]|nr:F0F1 ATP synthase subunit gamma [Alphaproteobacteria bacterium]